MPLTTPRGYPYSVPSDPADIPAALEAMARAVDADVQTRGEEIHARPMFRFGSSNTPISFYAAFTTTQTRALTFQTQDALVGDAADPVSGSVSRITPRLPGFWWFSAAFVYPYAGSSYLDLIGISLQTATTTLARHSTHQPTPQSDANNNLSVSAGTYMNGTTDYVQIMAHAHAPAAVFGAPPTTIRNRYVFGMRMTET